MKPIRPFRAESLPKPRGYDGFNLPNEMPLDIEVGCGVGMHAIEYALRNPDRYLVAIEQTSEKFRKFENSLKASGRPLPNLLAVHANAISWISYFVPSSCVDRYFFFYPNPYPKPKDQGKRWHTMPFFSKILETLKASGSVHLATNLPSYFEEASEYLVSYWGLRDVGSRAINLREDPEFKARTHFEKKYLERFETCWDGTFSRSPSSSTP